MEKVLVTGGSGFIALHCVQQLLDQGYAVRSTVRFVLPTKRKYVILLVLQRHSIELFYRLNEHQAQHKLIFHVISGHK